MTIKTNFKNKIKLKGGFIIYIDNDSNYFFAEKFKKNIKKPCLEISKINLNIDNLVKECKIKLKAYPNAFNEMLERIQNSNCYNESVAIINDYINLILN